MIVLIGDAMARPLIEAYPEGGYDALVAVGDLQQRRAVLPGGQGAVSRARCPNVVLTESIGSSETGFTGIGFVTADDEATDGPRVTPGPNTIVVDDDGRPAAPGVIGRLARGGHVPLGYYKDPEKTAALFIEVDGVRYSHARRLRAARGRRHDHPARPRQHLRQHRRARRSSPRRSRARSRPTRTCSTRSSSGCRTTASGSGSPR